MLPLSEIEQIIAKRMKAIFEAGPFTQAELAQGLGLTQPHVSRLLLGKSPWRKKHLEKFAKLYNKSIREIAHDPTGVPQIATICGDEGFDYRSLESGEVLCMSPAPPGMASLEGVYCVRVEGDCYKPVLAPGNVIYARKGDNDELADNALVIFVDEEGRGCLRRVTFSNDYIILKSLLTNGTDVVKPRSYLRMLDKVIWIKL